MPRFSRRRKRGWQSPGAAPQPAAAPKPPKLPRPKTKDLRVVLKGFVTADQAQRIGALAYALQWYDKAIEYCVINKKLPQDHVKTMERAVKARNQGNGTNIEPEKEQAYLTSVRLYEKLCAKLKPPSIDRALELYKAKKDNLEAKQSKLATRFGTALEELQRALSPKTADGKAVELVAADGEKERDIAPGLGRFIYNRNALAELRTGIRREGILPVALREIKYISRIAALEAHDGKYMLNPLKQLDAVWQLLENFSKFAMSPDAPRRLARHEYTPQPHNGATPTDAKPAAGARPRVHQAKAKGPRVDGLYKQGGTLEILYSKLKDGKDHEIADLQKLTPTADVRGRIQVIAKDAKVKGFGKVVIAGTKVTMTLTPATK